MYTKTLLTAATLLVTAAFLSPFPAPEMKKATLIITVEEIEPCLPFWAEGLSFEITATVPHEDKMGFAMLQGGAVEVMYQSRASLEADLGPAGAAAGFDNLVEDLSEGTATLFIEVEALDPVIEALAGATVVVPRRQTFYGTDEIFVMAPCGTLVGFAAQVGDGEG
jgi:uncharacterized glyoxalase superfamily protein PhnB